jgi:hypothetical protein
MSQPTGLSFPRRRESRANNTFVIPAKAGIQYVLDSRLRGNDKTPKPPLPHAGEGGGEGNSVCSNQSYLIYLNRASSLGVPSKAPPAFPGCH